MIGQAKLQSPVNVNRCGCVREGVHMSVYVHAYKDEVSTHIYACLCTEVYCVHPCVKGGCERACVSVCVSVCSRVWGYL